MQYSTVQRNGVRKYSTAQDNRLVGRQGDNHLQTTSRFPVRRRLCAATAVDLLLLLLLCRLGRCERVGFGLVDDALDDVLLVRVQGLGEAVVEGRLFLL